MPYASQQMGCQNLVWDYFVYRADKTQMLTPWHKHYNAWVETPETSQSTQESDTKLSPGSTKHERLPNKLPGLSTGRIVISILIIWDM